MKRRIVFIVGIVLFFAGCKKKDMEDVYSNSFPEDQYVPTSIYGAGGTVRSSTISSFAGDSATGLFRIYFGQYSDSHSSQLYDRCIIQKYKSRVHEDYHVYDILESAAFTFKMCKPNIVKIERIFKITGDHYDKWDKDILGYWVVFIAYDVSGKPIGNAMMSLDKQKIIYFK